VIITDDEDNHSTLKMKMIIIVLTARPCSNMINIYAEHTKDKDDLTNDEEDKDNCTDNKTNNYDNHSDDHHRMMVVGERGKEVVGVSSIYKP